MPDGGGRTALDEVDFGLRRNLGLGELVVGGAPSLAGESALCVASNTRGLDNLKSWYI